VQRCSFFGFFGFHDLLDLLRAIPFDDCATRERLYSRHATHSRTLAASVLSNRHGHQGAGRAAGSGRRHCAAARKHTLHHWIDAVTWHSFATSEWHVLGTLLLPLSQTLTPNMQLYAAIYLLIHGVIKLLIVWNLLRERLWAFPFSLITLALFVLLQTFHLFRKFSPWLLGLTILDVIVILLVSHEYRFRSVQGKKNREATVVSPGLPSAKN
jgi:uncharacterized membrane protein